MSRKKILLKVWPFVAESILFCLICIIGIVLALQYRNHVGMFILTVPVSAGYLLFFLNNLYRVFLDIYSLNIVSEELTMLGSTKRRFELLFMKNFYKIELYNNSKNKNQKKSLIMLSCCNIELGATYRIIYLDRSKLVVKLEQKARDK